MAVQFLEGVAAEIEAHVAQTGWERPPVLFALVRTAQLAVDEPETAARLGLEEASDEALTPVEQEPLPEGALDEVLARIAWPDAVTGCALSQEIVILPPSAQDEVDAAAVGGSGADLAAVHPDRREARLVVAVLRDGSSAALLRLRDPEGGEGELLTGPDLAPNLVAALLATLAD